VEVEVGLQLLLPLLLLLVQEVDQVPPQLLLPLLHQIKEVVLLLLPLQLPLQVTGLLLLLLPPLQQVTVLLLQLLLLLLLVDLPVNPVNNRVAIATQTIIMIKITTRMMKTIITMMKLVEMVMKVKQAQPTKLHKIKLVWIRITSLIKDNVSHMLV
jgi:hypothetical protein